MQKGKIERALNELDQREKERVERQRQLSQGEQEKKTARQDFLAKCAEIFDSVIHPLLDNFAESLKHHEVGRDIDYGIKDESEVVPELGLDAVRPRLIFQIFTTTSDDPGWSLVFEAHIESPTVAISAYRNRWSQGERIPDQPMFEGLTHRVPLEQIYEDHVLQVLTKFINSVRDFQR